MDESRKPKPAPKSLAYFDDLTGLYNRRYLELAQKDCDELQERNVPYSLAIIDIDHFKRINDTYGHLKGDEVIKDFAKFLKGNLRTSDTVVRYGGDEFVCVMTNAEAGDVHRVYDRLLARCKQERFGEIEVMISAGLASFPGDGRDFDQLLKLADESLYDAKRSGRGRLGVVRKKRIDLPTKIFIGRANELEVLSRFISEARVVRVGIIEGNIGIGKTRFTKEVISNLRGYEVLWSDCLAFFGGISYYPIRELIKYKISQHGNRIIKDIPLAYRIELGKLIPELMEEVKEKVQEVGLVLDKYRLYESIKRVLEYGSKPKVIVIDNMQWADLDTTETIKYLLRSLADQGVIFFFIYRQEEKTDVLEEFTSNISRETPVRQMALGALESNEVKEMIRLIINEEPIKELVRHIELGSGGNPLYIEELIKGLSDGGYLVLEGEQWRFRKPEIDVVPKSIEDILNRKYQELSAEGKQVLEIASVIGWFDIEILRSITGYNEGHIIGVLERLKHLGLVRERGARIEFQDEVSRNTVYKMKVSGLKGRSLHKQVADWFELRHQGREIEVLEELSLHYYRGGDQEKGARYCIEAGDRAKEKYAHQAALNYYTWAEELLRERNDVVSKHQVIDCLIKRAEVMCFVGDNTGALKNLDQGLKLAHEMKDKKKEADINYKKAAVYNSTSQYRKTLDEAKNYLNTYQELESQEDFAYALNTISIAYWHLGQYDEALANAKRAQKIAKELGDKRLEHRILTCLGNTYVVSGEYDQGIKIYEESLKIAKTVGTKTGESTLLNNIGNIYGYLGKYENALKYLEESLVIAQDIGDNSGAALTINNIGNCYFRLGAYKKALTNFEESLKIANFVDNKYCQGLCNINIGNIYLALGDYTQAFKYYDNSLKIRRDVEDPYGETETLNDLGNVCLLWGDYTRASEYYEAAVEIAKKIKSRDRMVSNFLSLGNLCVATNRLTQAKEAIDKAHAIAKDLDVQALLMEVLFSLQEFYLVKNDLASFKATMKELEGFSKESKDIISEGKIKILRGRYYTELKDFRKATKNFDDALKIFEGLKEPLTMGMVYYYLGIMQSAQGKKSMAKKYLEKAQKTFNALGTKGWQEKVKKASKVRV